MTNAGKRNTAGANGTELTRNNRFRETRSERESQRQPDADTGERAQEYRATKDS